MDASFPFATRRMQRSSRVYSTRVGRCMGSAVSGGRPRFLRSRGRAEMFAAGRNQIDKGLRSPRADDVVVVLDVPEHAVRRASSSLPSPSASIAVQPASRRGVEQRRSAVNCLFATRAQNRPHTRVRLGALLDSRKTTKRASGQPRGETGNPWGRR